LDVNISIYFENVKYLILGTFALYIFLLFKVNVLLDRNLVAEDLQVLLVCTFRLECVMKYSIVSCLTQFSACHLRNEGILMWT
jgi:hypothetical protein